jgi:hypothetical protein
MTRTMIAVSLFVIARAPVAVSQAPPGFEVVEVSHQDSAPRWPFADPDINACGQVVYNQINPPLTTSEIFLYDNGQVSRISFNTVDDAESVINDRGTIVWSSGIDGFGNGELLMLQGGTITSFGSGRSPSINEGGHIAWWWIREHSCHSELQIRFFDGENVVDITNDELSNHSPVVNDLDQIVFNRDNNCQQPWDGDIVLYEDGVTIEVSERFQPYLPYVNNLGRVAWSSSAGIELWEDGETILFTDWGWWPRLNNLGDMALMRHRRDTGTSEAWLFIASGENEGFHRLTTDDIADTRPNINDWAEMVWLATNRETDERAVRLLRRIRTGDSEFDGDIDHDDLARIVGGADQPRAGGLAVRMPIPGHQPRRQRRFAGLRHLSTELRGVVVSHQSSVVSCQL